MTFAGSTLKTSVPAAFAAALVVICSVLIAACASPRAGHAARTMQTSLMDDEQLLYLSPARAVHELQVIAALGVSQVKVSLVWSLVAPDPNSTQRPSFDASDPRAYPFGAWARYDRIVIEAHQLGLSVSFIVVPPAPAWAIPRSHFGQGERLGHAPDPTEFGQFVQAAGRRYSGNYEGLPRVSQWEIWNEPNFPASLNPYFQRLQDGHRKYLQPLLYRRLLKAAWQGLVATGHSPATDTILIGETVSPGVLTGAQFDRGLYCVSSKLEPLTGSAAREFGCATSGSRAAFVRANPALFDATGFAYHPYSFNIAPNVRYPLRGWITMQNLGSLEGLLDGAFRAYGQLRGGEVPLYLTEFGYESNPPNPYVKNSTAQQATWLNEAEYMAWKDPYVRMFNQFELIDSRPDSNYPRGSADYWDKEFYTGLEFVGGKPKPALAAFRLPIWLPRAKHGGSVTVWGQLRPANHSTTQTATIQYQPRGSSSWTSTRSDDVKTTNREGFFFVHVPIPSAGLVRLAWKDPANGRTYYSRTVTVS